MIAYRCAPTCYPVPKIPNEIDETTAAGLLPRSFAKSRSTFACSSWARFSLYRRSIRGIGAWSNRFSVSAGSDESEVFEGNQLLRIKTREVCLNLDVVIHCDRGTQWG